MNNKIIKRILSITIALIIVTMLSGGHKAYATDVSLVDMDKLYNTLIVGDMSYATTLFYNGSIDAYMAADADGIDIYVPDDPKGGTGTGVGIYRQDPEKVKYGSYTIYYGEFVNFLRNGHGSIFKTYKDSSYTFTRSFYGFWENDYPNGQGNESRTEETFGQNKWVCEASGIYISDKFTGTYTSISSYYAGSKYDSDGISTWTYPYVNGLAEGTVTWTEQKAGCPQETSTFVMSGGFPVNDRTSEYLANYSISDNFDPSTQAIVAWAAQNHYYHAESKVTPNTYDYSGFMALK